MYSRTKINSYIRLVFLFLLTGSVYAEELSSDFSDADLSIRGAAIYQELGRDYYVGSLYLADKTSASNTLLDYAGRQRIKIKVIAKRWSARKWKAQWQNNIAINNSETINAELMEQLSHFTQFPKSSLKKLDEILIDYFPETGSKVTFNGHIVLETSNKDFYKAILNTWLGKFSPNRVFREKISGQIAVEEQLIVLSASLVDEKRIAKVANWFVGSTNITLDPEKERQQVQRLQKEKNAKLKADQEKKEQLAEKQAEEKRLALAKAEKIEQERKRKAWLAKQVAEKKRKLEQKKLAQEKLARQKLMQQKLAQEKAEKERQNKQNQQDYLYKLYQYELQSKINESVQYPPWARQFNQEGKVIIDFTLDRSGSLLSLEKHRSLASKILLQEVEKRLALIIETHLAPKDLIGESWPFSVQYEFKLSQPEQPIIEKPQLVVVD